MAIECYRQDCKKHGCHGLPVEEGPFCFENECVYEPITLRVRVAKCENDKYWYSGTVGSEFSVLPLRDGSKVYDVHDSTMPNGFTLMVDDCEVLP